MLIINNIWNYGKKTIFETPLIVISIEALRSKLWKLQNPYFPTFKKYFIGYRNLFLINKGNNNYIRQKCDVSNEKIGSKSADKKQNN